METVLITGGTGMIGTELTQALLDRGYHVTILTRDGHNKKHSRPGLGYARWDPANQQIDNAAITTADHIIHLAGAGVADKRWTAKRKKEIVDSRVKTGELLVKAMKENPNKVKTVVSASAIGWYGADKSPVRPFVETDPPSPDFLGQTCQQWEDSLAPVTAIGKRLVHLRTGIVLSRKGGALAEFRKPLRFGIATILGNGKQVISWIHIDDLVALYIAAIGNGQISGPYNAVAPTPGTNKELVLKLARAKNGKLFVPVRVPSFALQMVLGEMSIEVLKSATVSSEKVEKTGFAYRYPTLDMSLQHV
jgi:uncharacterized protein (TIGR01777 family)